MLKPAVVLEAFEGSNQQMLALTEPRLLRLTLKFIELVPKAPVSHRAIYLAVLWPLTPSLIAIKLSRATLRRCRRRGKIFFRSVEVSSTIKCLLLLLNTVDVVVLVLVSNVCNRCMYQCAFSGWPSVEWGHGPINKWQT